MNIVSFINDDEIDIRAISHFGLHAKQKDDAIGYFGTGLKYAISVLIRTGHAIDIFSGTQQYSIALSKDSFRGKDMEFVVVTCPNGQQHELGFTTELAKNWEVWAAYREIACNCFDESGKIQEGSAEPEEGKTTIIVQGSAFYEAYKQRASIILESAPVHRIVKEYAVDAELHEGTGTHIYYRGIRAMELDVPALYTYNLTSRRELTEDRTLKHSPAMHIAFAYLESTDAELLERVLVAPRDTFEGRLDFDWSGRSPSETFMQVVRQLEKERATEINSSAFAAYRRVSEESFSPTSFTPSKVEQSKVDRACDFVERHGYDVRRYTINFVETLGRHTLACAYNGEIYITRQLINIGGATKLASALIEEFLHIRHDLADESREMQTFLFETLVSVYEELDGEAL